MHKRRVTPLLCFFHRKWIEDADVVECSGGTYVSGRAGGRRRGEGGSTVVH